MKINLLTVGKSHDIKLVESINDFTNRLDKYYATNWTIVTAKQNSIIAIQKQLEAEQLLDQLHKDDWVILLDERGKQYNNTEVANMIQTKANNSFKRLVFIIGGAFGVDDLVLKRANMVWSLSLLVFPHMIVRLMLAEQLYRACTINRNEKYHHI